jgi:hypothetical protein
LSCDGGDLGFPINKKPKFFRRSYVEQSYQETIHSFFQLWERFLKFKPNQELLSNLSIYLTFLHEIRQSNMNERLDDVTTNRLLFILVHGHMKGGEQE